MGVENGQAGEGEVGREDWLHSILGILTFTRSEYNNACKSCESAKGVNNCRTSEVLKAVAAVKATHPSATPVP